MQMGLIVLIMFIVLVVFKATREKVAAKAKAKGKAKVAPGLDSGIGDRFLEFLLPSEDPDNVKDVQRAKNRARRAARVEQQKLKKGTRYLS